jgi:thiol:disulfide interchange protein DsbG
MKHTILTLALVSAFTAAAVAQINPADVPAPLKLAAEGGLKVEKKFSAEAGLTGWVVQDRGRQIIVYTTPDNKHLIAGNLMDVGGRNLTKVYEEEHFTKPDLDSYWSQLEGTKWVKEGASDKDAKSTIYVFTDPNCPYCHAAWEMFQPYMAKGLQVRWITVGILGPSSQSKAAEILSASNPLEVHKKHNETFRTSKGVAGVKVNTEMAALLKKHSDLMREMGLSGTPGLVYKDKKGRVATSPGLPNAAAFSEMTGIR